MRHTYSESEAKILTGYFLKGLLKQKRMTYRKLAKKLNSWGWKEDEKSIANKLARKAFSAGFFVMVLNAVGEESIALGDIERLGNKMDQKALDLLHARIARNKSKKSKF